MSRREYPVADRYEERQSEFYRRPRRERDYEDLEVDIQRSRYDAPPAPSRRTETVVKESRETDVVTSGRRTERSGPRQPDFLKEDYNRRSTAGPLVVREEKREVEDETYSRGPGRSVREEKKEVDDIEYSRSRARSRRGSTEAPRSRPPPADTEKEEIIFRERSDARSRRPPYPPSDVDFTEKEEVIYRDSARSRPPPPPPIDERIDIRIRERFNDGPRSRPPPRTDFEEKDVEEIRFRRGQSERGFPPSRTVEKEDITIRDDIRESRSRPPRTEVDKDEIIFREKRSESRPRRARSEVDKEEIIFREKRSESRPPPPRTEVDKEEIIFREKRSESRPRPRSEVDKEEIIFREKRSESRPPPSRGPFRGSEDATEEIDIKIRDRSAPPPRERSMSRGQLVAKKTEEWVIRRPRSPSPSPSPPPRDIEKETIIIKRRERTPSPEPEPEPPREPTPPPPLEPIYRPPIIQEVITHHRHIDHGVERARSPTPTPPPSPPSEKEDNIEIEIRRSGTRNGKKYEEEIIIDSEKSDHKGREEEELEVKEVEGTEVSKRSVSVHDRSISVHDRERSVSTARRRYDDDVVAEADYYNRRVSSRAYPGEAYNGATKDWGLVDVPPGTERVRMDGTGGGRQEIYWDRYAGERRGKFITGDRVYEEEFGAALPAPPPPPPPEKPRSETVVRETRITETKVSEDKSSRQKAKDRMWTEITKDLVTKEAIEEKGYEYEETDQYFYVMDYLRYEDVLKLVETTEDIRRERRDRIREIQWERSDVDRRASRMLAAPPAPIPPRRGAYEDRFYERDVHYDRDSRRWR